MTHLKILTVLAGLAFLVACGGSATPADNNVDNMPDGDNTGGDNSGGDNSGGGNAGGGGNGGNATDCTATPFHADCNADAPALLLRESMCLADITTNPLCMGPTGIATLFCEADPFNTNAACMHNDFNDERTAIIDGCRLSKMGAGCADVAIPYACNADAFDTLCEKSYTIGYCFTGDNIANDERCGYDAEAEPNAPDPTDNALFTTRAELNCLGNPFAPACTDDLGASFAEVARVNRLAHCNDLDNFAEDTCFDATSADVCNDYDLFANICITEANNPIFQRARAHFCIGEGEGSDITDARCANAFPQLITRTAEAAEIANGCIANPFSDGCGVYLGGSTGIAQTNRITFCTDEANPGNAALAVCAGYTPCAVSPFHPICQQYFETARNERLELCKRAEGALPTTPACQPAQITGICDYDPFNEVCFTGALIAQYAPARAERLPFCELAENSDKTLCLEANYRKTINVTLGNWKAGVAALDPAIVVDAVAENKNEFLLIEASGGITTATLPSGLDSLGTISRILTLADFNLGGERADGVQYFSANHSAASTRTYAGILPDTDLGAPLTESTAMGIWDARIMSQLPAITFTQGRIDSEFQLEVDFDAGTIQAFLPLKATDGMTSFAATSGPARMIYLFIDGTFDKTAGATQGLISGEVTVAQFAGNVRTGAESNIGDGIANGNQSIVKATLTGLIGSDGAVGTYLRQGAGASGLTGAFIACPPRGCGTPAPCTFAQNCVTHADWVTAASADAGIFVASASTAAANAHFEQGTPANQFISSGPLLLGQGYSQVFSANLDIGSTGVGVSTENLGGDVKDGFSLGLRSSDTGSLFYYHAAIDPTTHLGSPLLQTSGSATWRGWVIILAGYTNANHSPRNTSRGFNLTLTFNSAGGTLDAFIPQGGVDGTAHHLIEGQFNASGIISGRTPGQGVIQADFAGRVIDGARTNITPGRLSGIIGQDGAVAVFISDDKVTNTNNFAGGFIARPVKPVDYNAWVAKVTPPITPTTDPARKHEFLKIGDPALVPTESTYVADLRMQGNRQNGIVFFRESSSNIHSTHYVGLLSSTDVGAPIPVTPAFIGQDVTASWPAQIRATGVFLGNFDSDNTGVINFTLTVNFTKRTLGALIRDSRYTTRRITINGKFPQADKGVITGTLLAEVATSPRFRRHGTLTGLIGAEGAVGAFLWTLPPTAVANHDHTPYAGGFVAAPGLPPQTAAKDAVVTYGDWLEIAAPDAALNATTPQNQFLQAIPPVFDLSGVDVGTVTNLNFGIFPGDVNSGVLLLQGAHVANGDTFSYAGILPNTNLGAPLGIPANVADQKVTWNGRIQTIGYALTAVTDGPDFKPFTLEVDLAKKHIEAFVQSGVPLNRNGVERDTHYWIRGQYDDRGVITARDNIPGVVHARFNGNLAGGVYTGIRTFITYADDRQVEGTLTGLIGTAGAVGAFYSTERSTAPDVATAGDSYVGGFVARP